MDICVSQCGQNSIISLSLQLLTKLFLFQLLPESINSVANWSYKTCKLQSGGHHQYSDTQLFTGQISYLLRSQ